MSFPRSGMWCCLPKVHLRDPHLTATGCEHQDPMTSTLIWPPWVVRLRRSGFLLARLGFQLIFLTLKNIQLAAVFRHSAGPDWSHWQQSVYQQNIDTLRPPVIQERLTWLWSLGHPRNWFKARCVSVVCHHLVIISLLGKHSNYWPINNTHLEGLTKERA